MVNCKTSCLYLCLLLLAFLIILTTFAIQWIITSIQFGLVGPPLWSMIVSSYEGEGDKVYDTHQMLMW